MTTNAMMSYHFHQSCQIQAAKIFNSKDCKCESGCSNEVDCENVDRRIECSPNCRNCSNQKFRNAHQAKVIVKSSGAKGRGLFADEDINEGTFIVPYFGDVISNKERDVRRESYKKDGFVNYFFNSGAYTIDPTINGNDAKFANHSCDPNMFAESWRCHGMPTTFRAIAFVASKDIKKGTELTFNYGNEYSDDMKCFCQSENCAGIVGKKPISLKKKATTKNTKTTVFRKRQRIQAKEVAERPKRHCRGNQ